MPQNDDPNDLDEDDDLDPDDGSRIKALRKKAKDYDAIAAERDANARELALYRAGLGDLTDRQRKALLATVDTVEVDDLKSAATELGFLKTEAPKETIPAAEQQAHQRVEAASAGTEAPAAVTDGSRILEQLDPRKLTEDEFWETARSLGATAE